MEKALYYLFLKPLSRLPLSVLYYLSDFMNFLFTWIIPYRRKVVLENLKNSFPGKTEAEITQICKAFYRHLCDVIVECIRLFSMSETEVVSRCKILNPAFFEPYTKAGKSLIIISGHYNNWELAAVGFSPQIKHKSIGIYKPLKSDFFNKKFHQSRGKYGLGLVPIKEVRASFEANINRLTAVFFGADQSPSRTTNVHWMDFLNQDTAVLYGSERYAKEYNYPVIFARILKARRGYYEVEFETIENNPVDTPVGWITERHTRALEELIRQEPQYWLWTHKRWKRKKIVNTNVLSRS